MPPEGEIGQEHDWCLATGFCRLCGASQKAVAAGLRGRYCDPDVIGISWVRATERMRDLMAGFEQAFGPMVQVPLATMETLRNGLPENDDPPPSAA